MLAAKHLSSKFAKKLCQATLGRPSSFSQTYFRKHLSVLHDEMDALKRLDVTQGVATHGDDVRKCARSHHSDLALHIEHYSRPRSGALDCIHGLHAECGHAREFLCDRLAPGNSSHICAEHNL